MRLDLISVSREPSNTRFQLAALAGLSKHQQPNREIKTIFLLVGVILEAHFWGRVTRRLLVCLFRGWIKANNSHWFRRVGPLQRKAQ